MRQIARGVLSLIILMCGCATAVRDTGGDHPLIAVKNRLSEVRGLPFKADVSVVVETKQRLQERLQSALQAELGDRQREDISLAYAKLGLLPVGIDLRSTLLKYYSAQAEGFYDPQAQAIVLAEKDHASAYVGSSAAAGINTRALVHELAHALQDQHFAVGAKLRPVGNSDQALALRVIAEADAMLTEKAYLFGQFDDWLPGYALERIAESIDDSAFSHVPAVVADKMLFQYSDALKFVSRLMRVAGRDALNLILMHPPLSTEQILHPEKYLSMPDPPTRIRLDNLGALFSDDWREIENDMLGELMVRCLFKQFVSTSEASTLAAGWDGDRFVAFRRGHEIAFVWATIWDSLDDAEHFLRGYRAILPKKHLLRPVEFYIERRGQMVLIVEGLKRDAVNGGIDSIWRGIETEELPFAPPALQLPAVSR